MALYEIRYKEEQGYIKGYLRGGYLGSQDATFWAAFCKQLGELEVNGKRPRGD